ncbi:MAG: energy transducer TonB [Muribaculaceae bacterium]|nr:energy transducer TonB [Muribaculaceae bacterium]
MERGKQTCRALKDLRQRIADANGIAYTPTECHHKGDCAGTCPACEAEVQYIEQQLSLRQMLGKAVVVAGLSLGVMAMGTAAEAATRHKTKHRRHLKEKVIKVEKTYTPSTLKGDVIPQQPDEETLLGMVNQNQTMPIFPGGDLALMKYLSENIVYPEQAVKDSIEGRVVVQFIVKKDGSIGDSRVVRSVHPLLDAEALRVVEGLPNFTPALQHGEPVNAWYILPVSFKLERKEEQE